MERKILITEPRTELGKGPTGRLRRSGRIPAVIYGHAAPVSVSINAREFAKAFHTVSESQIVGLQIGSETHDVLIKDYVEDIKTGSIDHIDFFEIERGKRLRTHIAVELTGSPIGVRAGGVLEHMLYEVEIECLPRDLPENLTLEIGALDLNSSLHVSDIVVPEGVRILNPVEQTVCAIASPRGSDDEDAGEGAVEEAVEA